MVAASSQPQLGGPPSLCLCGLCALLHLLWASVCLPSLGMGLQPHSQCLLPQAPGIRNQSEGPPEEAVLTAQMPPPTQL